MLYVLDHNKKDLKAFERSKHGLVNVNKLTSTRHPGSFVFTFTALFLLPALFLVKKNLKNSRLVVWQHAILAADPVLTSTFYLIPYSF